MSILDRDAILKADDLKTETIKVPEWGGEVIVRMMTGAERDSFEADIMSNGKLDAKNIRAKLAVRTIVGKDGKRLFTDEEVSILGGKAAKVLDRIAKVSQRLNAMTEADVAELAKNSDGVLGDDSTSS